MATDKSKQGGDLFIVDNSDESWKAVRYLHDWADIAHSFDIATGYFEIGALLALDGHEDRATGRCCRPAVLGLSVLPSLPRHSSRLKFNVPCLLEMTIHLALATPSPRATANDTANTISVAG